MQIAGIQKTTLLDYPGKVATIIFTPGCNFRCKFCHNPENVLPHLIAENAPHLIPEEAFFNFLDKRQGILDGVVVCGGEPTLQPDLLDFARKVKEKGFLFKLDTNGHNVQVVKNLLEENLLDYVAMDIKTHHPRYTELVDVNLTQAYFDSHHELVSLLINGPIDYEFRTTVIQGHHTAQDILSIAKYLQGARLFALQNFIPGKTIDPNFPGESFAPSQLEEFQNIAAQYVEKCIIR